MSDINIKTFLQAKREKEKQKDSAYRVSSRDRLKKIIETKIKTTMIGALDSIEKNMGFLWQDDENGVNSSEAAFFKTVFEKVRKEILDNGNRQIHALENELEQYQVEWTRYNLSLEVKE